MFRKRRQQMSKSNEIEPEFEFNAPKYHDFNDDLENVEEIEKYFGNKKEISPFHFKFFLTFLLYSFNFRREIFIGN